LAHDLRLHAGDLEHHAAGLDHGDPMVDGALAAAHADFGRLLGHRLVREDADPDLAAAAQVVGNGAPRRLDLAAVDPGRGRRLQPYLTEGDLVAGVGLPAPVAAVVLAPLDPLRHQHD